MDYILSLPDDSLAAILARTSPRDACRSSGVSTRFRAVSGSDPVWERFLPPDYQQMIARSTLPLAFATKKQLYFMLADSPIKLDRRFMSFALDKETGKKCYLVGVHELAITWGDTPQCWGWITDLQSRFAMVAKLFSVWWLEIVGRIDTSTLSSNTTYVAYLVYRTTRRGYGLKSVPMKASMRCFTKVGREQLEHETITVYLQLDKSMYGDVEENARVPRKRIDRYWMEVELGEFNSGGDGGGFEVEIALMEVEMGTLKSGLIVEGIEVRPKVVEI